MAVTAVPGITCSARLTFRRSWPIGINPRLPGLNAPSLPFPTVQGPTARHRPRARKLLERWSYALCRSLPWHGQADLASGSGEARIMVDTDLRRNHRSSARPAADSIACRMGGWRPSENSSSPPRLPAAARGRVFPWTCAKCSITRDRDQSCRSVHANGRVSCQSRSRSRPL